MAKSIDPWHFSRSDLACHYLMAVLAAARRPISSFGPRQTGKTTLLTTDPLHLAEQQGLVPIYVGRTTYAFGLRREVYKIDDEYFADWVVRREA